MIVFFDNEEEIFERIDFGAELIANPALRAHRSTALAVVRFSAHSGLKSDIARGPKRANKRIARRLRSASSLFRQEQLAGENIDEVHLSDDDKPLDWNRRAACLPTLTSLQLLLRATVADDAEPTRLLISGVGATGT